LASESFTPMAWINALLGQRGFALADAPPDPELRALLRLGEAAVATSPRLAVELSNMTTPRVRSLFPGETTFRTVSGLRFTADGRDIFAATLAGGYLPESRDFEAFMHLVRAGGVIVDVGSNFGLYALSAAIYARPLGRVFAFEPAPGAFSMLERNITQNDLAGTVTAKQTAVGAAAGHAQFYIERDVSFSSLHRTQRITEEASAVEVEIVTLDAALADLGSIDLLKIDVEGGEADVLSGARELLKRSPAAIVQFEFSHKNMDAARRSAIEDVLAALAQDGYRMHRRGVEGEATLPAPEEAFSGNLFLARAGQAEARLKRVLASTRPPPPSYDLGALALLQRLAEQTEAFKRAEALQRDVIEVADAVVGDGVVEGGTEAVRAVQRAWLDARQRVREAESQANALSASVEGRDTVIEQNVEKIANLRSSMLALEARTHRLEGERERLIEKAAAHRTSIEQLHQGLEETRQRSSEARQRFEQKTAAWRDGETKMRERIASLEASLKTSNTKLRAVRAANDELRQRLTEVMAQAKVAEHELSRVRNVAKRMVQRYDELRAKVGGEADAEGSSVD
jgi:FkbM family methyltransferase